MHFFASHFKWKKILQKSIVCLSFPSLCQNVSWIDRPYRLMLPSCWLWIASLTFSITPSWHDGTNVVILLPLDFDILIRTKPSDFGTDHQTLVWPSHFIYILVLYIMLWNSLSSVDQHLNMWWIPHKNDHSYAYFHQCYKKQLTYFEWPNEHHTLAKSDTGKSVLKYTWF